MEQKKLKIIIVCFPTLGGSGAVATNLGQELANRGHQVHFIAHDVLFNLNKDFNKNITFHLVENIEHPLFENASIYLLSLANKIAEVCRRYNIDIINTHFAIPHAAAAIMAKNIPGTKAKVINTFHGSDINLFSTNLAIREIVAQSVKQCDGLTSVASALAKQARKNRVVDKSQDIKIIYNWVKQDKYPAQKAKELRELFTQNDEKIITHVSNFREVKRIQDVIETFKGINKVVKSKLLLIGDGPEQRIAHRLIAKYKLINHVHVLGMQTNVLRILSISDLFLLPSKSEAFSLAALEAMISGVPVITTNVGGMPEMIQDGKTGFLADVGDVKTMVSKGIDVLTDTELHKRITDKAYEKATNEYNADVLVKQYEEYYHEVLTKN
jgi:N-acetyl-alpha-D-glucosaminyl L-malate synthase BshA